MVKLVCAIVVERSVFPVDIDARQLVGDLKDAIAEKLKYKERADKLQLYLAKQGDVWLTEAVKDGVSDTDGFKLLDGAGAPLKFVDLSEQDVEFQVTRELVKTKNPVHVLVEVPPLGVGSKRPVEEDVIAVLKKMKLMPKTLTEFRPLSVNGDEFQLDRLADKQKSGQPILWTRDLHEFWKGFGDFPQHYFVRMEEVVLWEVIKKLLLGDDRAVIVGSPGVGKSCLLMLVGLYLACIEKKKVLIIRRLKTVKAKNAVVFFDGKGKYARLTNLRPMDLFAIRIQAEVKDAIVLVDGFLQSETDCSTTGLAPFQFLATSCQFDAKPNDSSSVVVLPAWREPDLLHYAKLTEWVIETGLRKIKRQDTRWLKLVNEQYFYSGGSLREFCRTRDSLKMRVGNDCVNNFQAFDLMYNYGGGGGKDQVNRLRRHFITDCRQERHYYDSPLETGCGGFGICVEHLGAACQHGKAAKCVQVSKSR